MSLSSERNETPKPAAQIQIKQEFITIISSDEDEPPPPPPPKKNDVSPRDILACINKAYTLKQKAAKVSTLEERRDKSKDDESSKKTMKYRNEFYDL